MNTEGPGEQTWIDPSPLTITAVTPHGATSATLVVDGEIDVATASDLGAALTAISTFTEARLDLSHVTFIDSSGLRVLVAEHLRRGHAGQRLVIDNPSERVVKLLELTALMDQFDVQSD